VAHDSRTKRQFECLFSRAHVTPRPANADPGLGHPDALSNYVRHPTFSCRGPQQSGVRSIAPRRLGQLPPPHRRPPNLKTPLSPGPLHRPRSVQRGLCGGYAPHKPVVRYDARSLRLAPARDRVMQALRIAAHRDRCQCSDCASAFGA
jgi:hypothetical protein